MTFRSALAWALYWLGDRAAQAVVFADNWFFDVAALRLAGLYARLMTWSLRAQGSGPGPWEAEDIHSDL